MAINKPAIIDAVFHGTGTVAKNLLPPGVWSADADLEDDTAGTWKKPKRCCANPE